MKTLLLCALIVIVAGHASAQEATESFSPPEPEPNGREWVRMSSGEWLMGDLTNLRDDDFIFDSEDLDELTLDWEDVIEMRSPRVLTYVFEDKIVIAGTAHIKGNVVKIDDGTTVHEMEREHLLGIIEGEPKEINYWSAKVGFGFIGRTGNTEQVDWNTYVRIKREAAISRLRLDYERNFGEVSQEKTVDNQRASAILDWFVYKNIFITAPGAEYYSDPFQNIDSRITGAAAIGYFPVRNSKLEWSISAGGGYQGTRYESVEPGTPQEESTGTLIPATNVDWELTGALDLEFDYNGQISVPETKDAFHHAFLLLSVEIWNDNLKLETSVTWDHVQSPRPREDGSVPKRDDIRTYLGFSVEF